MTRNDLMKMLHDDHDVTPSVDDPEIILADGMNDYQLLSAYSSDDGKVIYIDIEPI